MSCGVVTYVYDGDGNRVAKTVAGITTNYLVDTNNPTGYAQVVDELQNGVVTKSFTYDYDAFGNLISHTGTTPNDYLYSGEQFDANLGFYYLRARYMSPITGRFASMDSFEGRILDAISLHKYLYSNANPANLHDPSGYNATTVDQLITVGIVATLVTTTALLLVHTLPKIKVEITVYELPEPAPAPSPEPSPEPIRKPIPPFEKDGDEDSELFYRAMSAVEYQHVTSNSGRLTLKESAGPGRESFVTQDLNYVATKSISDPISYGTMVKWKMQVGTVATLLSRGGIDNSIVDNVPSLRYLPHIREGDPNQVHIKFERGAITYGLRRNTVGLFNDRIKSYREIGQNGVVFP